LLAAMGANDRHQPDPVMPWSKQIRLEQDLSQQVGKNVDVRVISVEGLRNLRLMDPFVHFALATGVIVGE